MRIFLSLIFAFTLMPKAVYSSDAAVPILKKPASRIIALAPHLVEISYAVGIGDKLIAAVAYSNYPQEAKLLPRVGSYTGINVEAIVRLNPDLILAWRSGNSAKHLRQLEDLGFVVYYSEPHNLNDIATLMENVSALAGSETGAAAIEKYTEELQGLRDRYQSKSPVSVFYQVWNKPLQSLSGASIVSDVIDVCGGTNIFADAKTIAPKVSVESVLRKDPDAIVASGMGEERPEWLDEWRDWPQLTAVKNEHLFFVPPDLIQRHSPRLLKGARIMCEQLEEAREKNSSL